MFCSKVPFSLLARTYHTYSRWNFTYIDITERKYCRELWGQLLMAQFACYPIPRSVFVRACLVLIPIFIILIFGSWPVTHAQHASGKTLPVSHHYLFYYIDVFWTDGFSVSHSLMIEKFSAAFFKMGLLGQAHNRHVSNWWYIVTIYPSHWLRLAQLIDCSSVIPAPPALHDVIEFPPQEFLRNVDQSVSSPWFFHCPYNHLHNGLVFSNSIP